LFPSIKKVTDFLLFTSIYIAGCAVVMTYQTFLLFDYPVNSTLLYFVWFGTLCSYNFHWLLTPAPASTANKASWHYKHRLLHIILAGIGLVGASYYGFHLLAFWPWLLSIAFITFLYSAPKLPFPIFRRLQKIAVAKTAFLTLVWTYVTAILPLVINTNHWSITQHLYIFNRFYFIYAICILFDNRDKESDRLQGIRSLVTNITDKGISVLFWTTIAVTLLSNIALFYFLPLIEAVTFFIPLLLLCLMNIPINKTESDYYYYFILDGLMMLSGLLFIFIQI
jgi:hypothetical protein